MVIIGASYVEQWNVNDIAGWAIINKGISGEQSFETLARFEKDVIALKPEVVLIWGFINDIHRSKREAIKATVTRVKESLKQMATMARDQDITPILATEVTIRPPDTWKETIRGWIASIVGKRSYQDYVNSHVLAINQWLRDYAQQENVFLLDIQPVISDDNRVRKKAYATEDGTHISERGYEELTAFADRELNHYFKSQ